MPWPGLWHVPSGVGPYRTLPFLAWVRGVSSDVGVARSLPYVAGLRSLVMGGPWQSLGGGLLWVLFSALLRCGLAYAEVVAMVCFV